MEQVYLEQNAEAQGDHSPASTPNHLLSKAVMTRSLTTTHINFNGPITGWSSSASGCFDYSAKAFQYSKFTITKPGNYQISYSLPYQLSDDVVASYDGLTTPGFLLVTGDPTLINFHPLLAIDTPTMKCFVKHHTLTLCVTWKLPQEAQVSIFYLSSAKNQNVEKDPIIPLTIAPNSDQRAWWSITRLAS